MGILRVDTIQDNSGNPYPIPEGGGSNRVFYENDNVVDENYTITSGKNAFSAGPIQIADGTVVTIPEGSSWQIGNNEVIDNDSIGASAWGSVSSTGIILGALNVASTVRTAVGTYQVTFNTSMPNDNYSVTVGGQTSLIRVVDKTTSGFGIETYSSQSALGDVTFNFAVFSTNALVPTGGTGTDAWASVQTNGTLNASFNVASVTKTAAGTYDVVFTTSMPTSNYAITGSSRGSIFTTIDGSQTTSGFTYQSIDSAGIDTDSACSFTVNATNATLPSTLTQDMVVLKTGDTMSGNLIFGNNDIVLNANAGDISTTGNTITDRIIFNSTNGSFRWNWNSGNGGVLTQYVDLTPFNMTYCATNNITLGWGSSQVTANIDGAVSVLLGTSSDYRLKENVRPSVYGTEAVKALKPVTYELKEDGKTLTGFIAHEADEAVPGAAHGEKDGEMMQSIDTYPIVAALTKALQESIERIEVLEAEVQSLKLSN